VPGAVRCRRLAGQRALQVERRGDGADGLAAVARLAHGAAHLGAAGGRVHRSFAFGVGKPLVGQGLAALLAEGGEGPFCAAVCIRLRVHRRRLDGEGDDVPAVLGGLGAAGDGATGHPAPVRVAQDAALLPAMKSFALICGEKTHATVRRGAQRCPLLPPRQRGPHPTSNRSQVKAPWRDGFFPAVLAPLLGGAEFDVQQVVRHQTCNLGMAVAAASPSQRGEMPQVSA